MALVDLGHYKMTFSVQEFCNMMGESELRCFLEHHIKWRVWTLGKFAVEQFEVGEVAVSILE